MQKGGLETSRPFPFEGPKQKGGWFPSRPFVLRSALAAE